PTLAWPRADWRFAVLLDVGFIALLPPPLGFAAPAPPPGRLPAPAPPPGRLPAPAPPPGRVATLLPPPPGRFAPAPAPAPGPPPGRLPAPGLSTWLPLRPRKSMRWLAPARTLLLPKRCCTFELL